MSEHHNQPLRDCHEFAIRIIEVDGHLSESEWQHCIGYSCLEEAVEDVATDFLDDEEHGIIEAWTYLGNRYLFAVRCETRKIAHIKKLDTAEMKA